MKVRMITKAAALIATCSLLFLACQNSSGGAAPSPDGGGTPPSGGQGAEPDPPVIVSQWTNPQSAAGGEGSSEAYLKYVGDAAFNDKGGWYIESKIHQDSKVAEGTYAAGKLAPGAELTLERGEFTVTAGKFGDAELSPSAVASATAAVSNDGATLTISIQLKNDEQSPPLTIAYRFQKK